MNTVEKNKIITFFLYGKSGVSHDRYHNSWDELMFVVKKIKSLNVPYGWGYHNAICASLIDCNIEETYKYCFEFIERYLLETNK